MWLVNARVTDAIEVSGNLIFKPSIALVLALQ